MHIWIIGGSGLVGRSLIRELQKRNISFSSPPKAEVNLLDIDQLDAFAQDSHANYIINLAAYTQVDRAEKEAPQAHDINVTGVQNLAEVATKHSMKIIHLSTDYVFSGKSKLPYKEEDLAEPLNVYGKTKREGEVLLQKIAPSSLIIRTSWLFSDLSESHFVSKMAKLMQAKKEVMVVSDQWGKPTFVPDLVHAILNLLDYERIIHVASPTILSWYEFASKIYERLKKPNRCCKRVVPILSSEYPTLAKRPSFSALDTSKYESLFGKMPLLEDRLDQLLDGPICV